MADLASAKEWEKGGKWWKILGEGGSRDIKIIKVMMSFNSFSPKPVLDNPRTVGKLRSSAVPVSDRASKLFITLVAGHFDHPTSEGGAPGVAEHSCLSNEWWCTGWKMLKSDSSRIYGVGSLI
jgi:hypothetical protein